MIPFGQRTLPDWPAVRLGRILTRSKESGRLDLPLLSVNLPDGVVARRSTLDARPAPSEDLSAYLVVRPGRLVVNPLGKPHGSLGVSALTGIISPAYLVADIHADVEPRFLHYVLRTRLYIAEYERRGKWMPPSQFNISWDQFKQIGVALPRRELQRRIAASLDRECARIGELSRLISEQLASLGEARADAVLRAVSKLHVGPLKYGFVVTDCKHRTPEYVATGYPVISTREVKTGTLDLSTVDRYVGEADYLDMRSGARDPRQGDIIYSRNASVGTAAYIDRQFEVCMGQDVVLITRSPRDCELLTFVLNFAISDQVDQMSVGSTFSRINVPMIRSLRVPYDRADEEERALSEIKREFGRFRDVEQEMAVLHDRLVEYRDALITEAVTGRLDITRASESQMAERLAAAGEGERPEVLAR